jgi:hypothetical protein
MTISLRPLLAATLVLAACAHSQEPSTQAPEPTAAAPTQASASEERPDTKHHMSSSFWAAVDARDAVIAGDLDEARANGDFLAHQPFADLPERWRHWVKQMQVQAAELAIAPDLQHAATAVARMSLSCGDCHYQMHQDARGIGHAQSAPAAERENVEARMLRHERIADDLWNGLIRPSDSDWSQGARGLVEAPPQPPTQDGQQVDPAFAQHLNEIKAMGLQAVTAKTHPERAEVFGNYLARCVDCHQATP